jgi:hypothetical protein
MSLPNITGWATPQGDVRANFTGVNFTWLIMDHLGWNFTNQDLCAKFIATDGFTTSKNDETLISNATHCHILAYRYNNQLMTVQFQLWLVPVSLDPGTPISFNANQHPRMVNKTQIISCIGNGHPPNTYIFLLMIFFAAIAFATGLLLIHLQVQKTPPTPAQKNTLCLIQTLLMLTFLLIFLILPTIITNLSYFGLYPFVL